MKYPLIKVNEIPDEGSKVVEFFGREVHVYKVQGKPKAVANVCMHFGGPLEFIDCKLVCPWHDSEFDVATGHRLVGPTPSNSKLMFLSTIIEDETLTYIWGE